MYRIGEVWAVAGGGVGERMDGFIHADVDVRGTDMSWTAKSGICNSMSDGQCVFRTSGKIKERY